MIPSLDASSQKFLADLDRLAARSERAQRHIATGLRVTAPSDAPDQIGGLLQARADLDRTRQSRQNLERVKTELESGELAIANAVLLLDRASTLGSQGASGTQSADTRRLIAGEVEGILRQLVALSNTTVEGRYIFSGDSDQTAPYAVDLLAPGGVTPYLGSASTRQVEDADGVRFPVALTAEQIFSDPGGNTIFTAVNALRTALEADDVPGVQAQILALTNARDHLGRQQAFYGTVIKQAGDAIEGARKRELGIQASISRLQDAGLVEASLELTQARIQHEAALSARARVPRTSLFDYLG